MIGPLSTSHINEEGAGQAVISTPQQRKQFNKYTIERFSNGQLKLLPRIGLFLISQV